MIVDAFLKRPVVRGINAVRNSPQIGHRQNEFQLRGNPGAGSAAGRIRSNCDVCDLLNRRTVKNGTNDLRFFVQIRRAEQRVDIDPSHPAVIQAIYRGGSGWGRCRYMIELFLKRDGANGRAHPAGGSSREDFERDIVRRDLPLRDVGSMEAFLALALVTPGIEGFNQKV